MSVNNHNKLFVASCLALTVTAMTFAIRAGILGQLSRDFGLSDVQLGWINAMAFLGFPIATMVGGLIYNLIGAKKLVLIAFIGHVLGLVLTITADGFWALLISSFCIGFANGSVEAGCNPLVASIYSSNKTTMLNRFHVWFPGGIVVGALVSKFMTDLGFGWQAQIAVMLLPTAIYGYLILSQDFPRSHAVDTSTANNIAAMFSPLFLFVAFCMTLTATSELGTQQWIERILGAAGASPMLIMAMITGVMAIGRYFAAPIVKKLNPEGVLLYSAIVTSIGIYSMSVSTGHMLYISALIFAFGVTYFWPTMLGFVAENIPQAGALGMSIMGGIGMFAVSMWNPIIGGWIDQAREEALAAGGSPQVAELIAGQATLENLNIFPLVCIVAFLGLNWYMRKRYIKSSVESATSSQAVDVN
ncbi:MFS transporter [Microbulbifer magnicolonia]|uniref:MFS transporter n=1 Tax=Microbulbifer magnicolonia TaxID=3109744 RepID=UPI002B405B1F|nr:MFS transporter [Microbulbifer sp. GG15]